MTDLPQDHDAVCAEMRLLAQADLDGELDIAATARLAAHLRGCPGCTGLQAGMLALSARMRAELPPYPAPLALRRMLRVQPAPSRMRRLWTVPAFAAGAALAATLLLTLAPVRPGGLDADGELVSSHIRALQPGHMIDVASSDQHTVKPWFDGRIDYAPPVRDFAAAGFPLAGGRLDYLAGRPVAALAYRHDRHQINLYVWPGDGAATPQATNRDGYTVIRWSRDGMRFRAVSDLEVGALLAFARLWQQP